MDAMAKSKITASGRGIFSIVFRDEAPEPVNKNMAARAHQLLDHFAIFECPAGTGLQCIYHISTEGDPIEDQGG